MKSCANILGPLHNIYDLKSAYKWANSKRNSASTDFKKKVLS